MLRVGDRGSGRGSDTDGSVEQSNNSVAVFQKAKQRLRNYLIKGVVNGDFVASFYSTVVKRPANIGKDIEASVVMGNDGITLVYDVNWIIGATDGEISYSLEHELLHVVNMHFVRGDEIRTELGIKQSEWLEEYVKYADLPVNRQLECHSDYGNQESNGKVVTYDTERLDYYEYPTFESLVRYVYARKKEDPPPGEGGDGPPGEGGDEPPGEEPGEGGTPVNIVEVDEEGNTSGGGGDNQGPSIPVPKNSREGEREAPEAIEQALRSAQKSAGDIPANLKDTVERFFNEYADSVLKGWKLLEKLLVGERAVCQEKKRVYKRLHRRFQIPPGKTHERGFTVGFIVDESGSMSAEEVDTAFGLIKKVCLKENNDCIYVFHWDTEPHEDVEEIRYESDLIDMDRKKGGGTRFTDIFSHELVREKDVDLYVIVTDGYPFGWPEKQATVPQVWIITQEGGYEQWKNDYGKGIAVCVEEGR